MSIPNLRLPKQQGQAWAKTGRARLAWLICCRAAAPLLSFTVSWSMVPATGKRRNSPFINTRSEWQHAATDCSFLSPPDARDGIKRHETAELPQKAEQELHAVIRPVALIAASLILPVPKEQIPGEYNGQCHLNQLSLHSDPSFLHCSFHASHNLFILGCT